MDAPGLHRRRHPGGRRARPGGRRRRARPQPAGGRHRRRRGRRRPSHDVDRDHARERGRGQGPALRDGAGRRHGDRDDARRRARGRLEPGAHRGGAPRRRVRERLRRAGLHGRGRLLGAGMAGSRLRVRGVQDGGPRAHADHGRQHEHPRDRPVRHARRGRGRQGDAAGGGRSSLRRPRRGAHRARLAGDPRGLRAGAPRTASWRASPPRSTCRAIPRSRPATSTAWWARLRIGTTSRARSWARLATASTWCCRTCSTPRSPPRRFRAASSRASTPPPPRRWRGCTRSCPCPTPWRWSRTATGRPRRP